MDNKASNLRWMTVQENIAHQHHSPAVIKTKQVRKMAEKLDTNRAKLTIPKVMLLKKLLNEGKPMKQLVKIFKVSETQIYRIKRRENWAEIPAAN